MNPKAAAKLGETFATECIAFRVRVLNRVITNLYDAALKPFGITVNQTTILAMLSKAGKAGPGDIGRALVMEKSTVSRNLERMRKKGWIDAAVSVGAASQIITVTPEGRKLLAAVHPQWQKAQQAASDLLGGKGVSAILALHETLRQTTGSA